MHVLQTVGPHRTATPLQCAQAQNARRGAHVQVCMHSVTVVASIRYPPHSRHTMQSRTADSLSVTCTTWRPRLHEHEHATGTLVRPKGGPAPAHLPAVIDRGQVSVFGAALAAAVALPLLLRIVLCRCPCRCACRCACRRCLHVLRAAPTGGGRRCSRHPHGSHLQGFGLGL
jgi:hypothetical protein